VFGNQLSLYASDEREVIAFQTSDQANAKSWGVALQEAVFEADEERGYKKFGYLEIQGKRKWVVITSRHCLMFPSPMKISEIQNAGAFDRVLLSNCDVTAFGDSGFVLSERKLNSKVGEKLKVVSFSAESKSDCRDWMSIVESLVEQYNPSSSDNEGVPYHGQRIFFTDKSKNNISIQLDAMGVIRYVSEIERVSERERF
jgi:hypothetical protein